MSNGQIDLLKLFQAAAGALQQNKSALNQADTYNHDHGDNMVKTFNTIVQALQQKQDTKPAAQLKYVSQQLAQNATTSGSGKTYAQGFAQAAGHFKGTEITLESILPLIQMILGGGQATTQTGSSADLIGSILGSLTGGGAGQSGQGLDLGGLLGGLFGGQSGSSSSKGGDLLGSLIGGLVSNSQMADTASHTQSGQIVTGSILQALSQLLVQ